MKDQRRFEPGAFGGNPFPKGYGYPGYPVLPQLELATAHVPWQRFTRVYSPWEALEKGTLFPELFKPYKPKEV